MNLKDSVRVARLACPGGRRSRLASIATALWVAILASGALAQETAAPRALPTQAAGVWKGDFDGMMERRAIRVLVPYSRTLYFNDAGRERGITADNVRDFERFVNQKYQKQLGKRPLTVVIRPTTRDLLLKHVADGLGDIAAGNLTATEARMKIVDFVAPSD